MHRRTYTRLHVIELMIVVAIIGSSPRSRCRSIRTTSALALVRQRADVGHLKSALPSACRTTTAI